MFFLLTVKCQQLMQLQPFKHSKFLISMLLLYSSFIIARLLRYIVNNAKDNTAYSLLLFSLCQLQKCNFILLLSLMLVLQIKQSSILHSLYSQIVFLSQKVLQVNAILTCHLLSFACIAIVAFFCFNCQPLLP